MRCSLAVLGVWIAVGASGPGCVARPPAIRPPDLEPLAASVAVVILPMEDARPAEERQPAAWQLATFRSHDGHFDLPVTDCLTEALARALVQAGCQGRRADTADDVGGPADFRLVSRLRHCQVIERLSIVSAIPHPLLHLATHDELEVKLELEVRLIRNADGLVLIDDTIDLSHTERMPTGVFNLSRIGRGRGFPIEYLKASLEALAVHSTRQVVDRLRGVNDRSARAAG